MLSDRTTTLEVLRDRALAFRDERDWAQFHKPKDLALALGIEAAELGELFLWKSEEEIDAMEGADRERVADEMADVLVYLLYLSEAVGIDVAAAVEAKLAKNARKYPVEQARGSAAKWTELG